MKHAGAAPGAGLPRHFPENQLGASLKLDLDFERRPRPLDFPENQLGASLKRF